MFLWAYSFLTYNLSNNIEEMNMKSLVLTIYPGELFFLKFFHFLGTTETGAVGPLSSAVLGCPIGARDSQLIRT